MNDIFEKIQNDFNEFMKKAKELIEKERVANTTKTKRWKPKDGEFYYYINTSGDIDNFKWFGVSGSTVDNKLYKINNCFKTEEEAQKELDRRIAEQELLDMCDWKDGECSEIVYDFRDKEFSVKCLCTETCYSPYRFVSKESAKKAIDTLGTERLKLIFRID